MYLYAIKNTDTGYIKLGYSADPQQRVRELQTGNSGALRLIHTARIREDRARIVEQKLHHELAHHRIRGEWFNLAESKAQGMINWAIMRYEDDQLL
jgi:hypothetical protein